MELLQSHNLKQYEATSMSSYFNKPKGLEVAKEDQIAHMPYGR